MQDGVTPHIVRQLKQLLNANIVENHVISRSFPDVWSLRLQDLNPCDFWLMLFLKHHVFGRRIKILYECNASVKRYVAETSREFFHTAIKHTIMRFLHVIDVNGEHVEHTLFK